jgi:hypothetical protein
MRFTARLRADEDVDDRLGDQPGYCSASEVLDPKHVIP